MKKTMIMSACLLIAFFIQGCGRENSVKATVSTLPHLGMTMEQCLRGCEVLKQEEVDYLVIAANDCMILVSFESDTAKELAYIKFSKENIEQIRKKIGTPEEKEMALVELEWSGLEVQKLLEINGNGFEWQANLFSPGEWTRQDGRAGAELGYSGLTITKF